MRARRGGVRRRELARRTGCAVINSDRAGVHLRRQAGNGYIARHAFLEQQFRRFDHRLGMEALAHCAVVDHVRDAEDHHALVMGHIGLNHDIVFVFRKARARVVDSFVPAIGAERANARETVQILARRDRRHHGGETGSIGRDHRVLTQAAFYAEIGNAEAGILIVLFAVARVVLRFRNAPGQAKVGGVVDLATHRGAIGKREQAAARLTHDEGRHQILEHRSRPGLQRGGTAQRR